MRALSHARVRIHIRVRASMRVRIRIPNYIYKIVYNGKLYPKELVYTLNSSTPLRYN